VRVHVHNGKFTHKLGLAIQIQAAVSNALLIPRRVPMCHLFGPYLVRKAEFVENCGE
jgi:hypothetical protein